jgi:hypothetical protein
MQLFLSRLYFGAINGISCFRLFWIPHSIREILHKVMLFSNSILLEANWFGDDYRVTSHVIEHIANFCDLIPSLVILQEIVA